jgi:hypothetical protein
MLIDISQAATMVVGHVTAHVTSDEVRYVKSETMREARDKNRGDETSWRSS